MTARASQGKGQRAQKRGRKGALSQPKHGGKKTHRGGMKRGIESLTVVGGGNGSKKKKREATDGG